MSEKYNSNHSIFFRIGLFGTRKSKQILNTYLFLTLIAGIIGIQVFSNMKTDGFNDPNSDSVLAASQLLSTFRNYEPAIAIAIESDSIIDLADTEAQDFLTEIVKISGISRIESYWSANGSADFISIDKKTAMVLVFDEVGYDLKVLTKDVASFISNYQSDYNIYAIGEEIIASAFTEQIKRDLILAEAFAIPISSVLLIFVFGSLIAAGLPFLVAGGTILGSFALLYLVSQITDLSIFSLNLITGLGLALGIDYALLIINRFREELQRNEVPQAVAVTTATAGKTIFVSAIAVAVSLASLLVFPQYFLRSFAYAGIAVSLLAMIGSLTVLPAMLTILGHKVNRFKVRRRDLAPRDDGKWADIAQFVMRRPWIVLISTSSFLLVLAIPAFSVNFGQVDERALPISNETSQAYQKFSENFPSTQNSKFDILINPPPSDVELSRYIAEISKIPVVDFVRTPDEIIVDGNTVLTGLDSSTWLAEQAVRLEVTSSVRPISSEAGELLEQIRSYELDGSKILVGGVAAEWADATSGVIDRIWIIALWLAIATLVIFFLFTGSVLLPVKAIIMNILGLGATLGALVWTFQYGNFQWLTGDYIITETIDISTFALIAVIAFALSMDYEVFLISRIKEEWELSKSTKKSVALGLQRTGRIVTAAALLIAIVFASFLSSGATNIKQLGFGVTVAILIDATLIRALLVPAFMEIAGKANWWAPPLLVRIHRKIGLREQ